MRYHSLDRPVPFPKKILTVLHQIMKQERFAARGKFTYLAEMILLGLHLKSPTPSFDLLKLA